MSGVSSFRVRKKTKIFRVGKNMFPEDMQKRISIKIK